MTGLPSARSLCRHAAPLAAVALAQVISASFANRALQSIPLPFFKVCLMCGPIFVALVTSAMGCLIGAGALITEGKEIPDGSLVMGAPGKVIRLLDAEAQARLLRSALNYQANMRRFRAGLSPDPA